MRRLVCFAICVTIHGQITLTPTVRATFIEIKPMRYWLQSTAYGVLVSQLQIQLRSLGMQNFHVEELLSDLAEASRHLSVNNSAYSTNLAQRNARHPHAPSAGVSRAQPRRERMAIHARQLAVEPHLPILRRYRRSLLLRLDQARRAALAHHVPQVAPVGPWVLINALWYKGLSSERSVPQSR